jgi:aryl-alcohol dehydrogenase-like predicted oxidoreductase
MKYRILGRTGLTVSDVGLGTISMGGPFRLGGYEFGRGEVDDRNSVKTMQVALDAGVNIIDTADIYGFGHAEELVGQAIAGRREKSIIVTKVGNRGDEVTWAKDFTSEWIRKACEASLKRMRTDYIDTYLLHTPDDDFVFSEEVFTVFNALKAEGKIRFFGCSVTGPKQGMDLIQSGFGDVVEVEYSIWERSAAEDLFIECENADMGVLIKAPLASGLLTGKYNKNSFFDSNDFRTVLYPREQLNLAVNVADYLFGYTVELGVTMPQLCLKYVLSRKEVSSVIAGGKTAGQILENVRASDMAELPVAVLEKIETDLSSFMKRTK